MPIDVESLRADTPGCDKVVHLNNAGASLMPTPVLEAVIEHLRLEAAIGGYEAKAAALDKIEAARSSLARLVGAEPFDVMLTESDTASFAKAFWGLALAGFFDHGGRVLVDRIAYGSHYLSLLQARERFGIEIEVMDSTPDGSIDLEQLARRLERPARLVVATHVATHRGLVNPVAAVGALAAGARVPLFLDACQSAGQMPLDVTAIGCAVATGTGRKFLRGPRGTGWLYVAPEWSEQMVPIGVDATSGDWLSPTEWKPKERATRFEVFESSFACRIGLGTAIDYALETGVEAISKRIKALSESLRERLGAVGATVHDGGAERCGIISFTVPSHPARQVVERLARAGINVVASDATFNRIDLPGRGLESVVRASPHAFNTEEELELLVGEIVRL